MSENDNNPQRYSEPHDAYRRPAQEEPTGELQSRNVEGQPQPVVDVPPAQSAESGQMSDSTQPAEPAQPFQPAQSEPAQTFEPAQSAQSSQPVDATQSFEPTTGQSTDEQPTTGFPQAGETPTAPLPNPPYQAPAQPPTYQPPTYQPPTYQAPTAPSGYPSAGPQAGLGVQSAGWAQGAGPESGSTPDQPVSAGPAGGQPPIWQPVSGTPGSDQPVSAGAPSAGGPETAHQQPMPPAWQPQQYGQPQHPGQQQTGWYGAPGFGGPPQQPPQPPYGSGSGGEGSGKPKRFGARKVLAAGLLALLLAGGGGAIGGLIVHAADSDNTSTSAAAAAHAAPIVDRSNLASIAANVQDSVVSVVSQADEGSGVVLSADGYVLTNNHVVVGANGGSLQVTFHNGKTVAATVVGTDAKTDLAVLKAQGASGLTPAKFADSDQVQVGDTVLAIGSPLGLDGSVTAGIVSALNRTIDESADQGQQPDPTDPQQQQQQQQQPAGPSIAGAIQTDAAINPGNSGGALVNTAGQVIGINTAIATSGQSEGNVGIGFAIPANKANTVANDLIKGQKVSHPYIGIEVGSADGNAGAEVASVVSGSPAEKAGLQQNDVITKVDDKDVHNQDDLLNIVQASKVGDNLQLTVSRGGATKTLTLTVGESS